MKVVHVPFGYYPDAVGGTEVYVAELARGLSALGVESVVAAPSAAPGTKRYAHDGVPVFRFGVEPRADVGALYGDGDPAAAAALGDVLDESRADVLHLHSFTRAASVRSVRAAHRRGVAAVYTYHTPTASCVRGTLLHDGLEPCDGTLIEERCASCLLQSRGVPAVAREAIVRLPASVGASLASTGASARWITALRARELTAARHEAFRTLLREADAVVAVCEWVRSLLVRAGVAPGRLVLSRQGTAARPVARPMSDASVAPPSECVRLAFVGRLHATKGVHVLLAALAERRELALTLDIFGVVEDAEGARYRDDLARTAGADPRVRFHPALPPDAVVRTLADYDVTVVPSQWLETGPLTVLESFAAGVPVLGSNLGGIAELVTHDRDGWLVPHANVGAWGSALARLANDRVLVARVRAGVAHPRSTDDAARDMASVYQAVVPRRSPLVAITAGGVG